MRVVSKRSSARRTRVSPRKSRAGAAAFVRRLVLATVGALVFASAAYADSVGMVVPTVVIYPGQVISDELLGEKTFTIRNDAIGLYAVDPEQVSGRIARRTLLPGKAIALSSVREPYVVERGVPAPLVFTRGSLVISAVGTPLESGGIGDFIRIRNADSGRIVSGTVLADGSVQVGLN